MSVYRHSLGDKGISVVNWQSPCKGTITAMWSDALCLLLTFAGAIFKRAVQRS